jgi:hypothetical protein
MQQSPTQRLEGGPSTRQRARVKQSSKSIIAVVFDRGVMFAATMDSVLFPIASMKIKQD